MDGLSRQGLRLRLACFRSSRAREVTYSAHRADAAAPLAQLQFGVRVPNLARRETLQAAVPRGERFLREACVGLRSARRAVRQVVLRDF